MKILLLLQLIALIAMRTVRCLDNARVSFQLIIPFKGRVTNLAKQNRFNNFLALDRVRFLACTLCITQNPARFPEFTLNAQMPRSLKPPNSNPTTSLPPDKQLLRDCYTEQPIFDRLKRSLECTDNNRVTGKTLWYIRGKIGCLESSYHGFRNHSLTSITH